MNYLQVLNFGTKNLKNINSSNNYLDSELLLAEALNLSREKILINLQRKIQKKQFDKFKQFVKRRSKNEPVAYIIKKKEAIHFTNGQQNSVFNKLNQVYSAQSSSLNAILSVVTLIMVIILYVISELFVTSG